ncbi:uncharacterized protein AB675_1683 [Cyphellophora attinorum]|uniref:RING-type domain-containing protein n=1 Tax=Cyphellophora attinorum TaxID=1664694 RepID=A0A0N0NJ21_9EURO|nr:uncharacterized protein AB675_1683 [Phialophora attinorum]KPI36099.1 hypothetical protein AB675_1683 [Phialophora attinorum]
MPTNFAKMALGTLLTGACVFAGKQLVNRAEADFVMRMGVLAAWPTLAVHPMEMALEEIGNHVEDLTGRTMTPLERDNFYFCCASAYLVVLYIAYFLLEGSGIITIVLGLILCVCGYQYAHTHGLARIRPVAQALKVDNTPARASVPGNDDNPAAKPPKLAVGRVAALGSVLLSDVKVFNRGIYNAGTAIRNDVPDAEWPSARALPKIRDEGDRVCGCCKQGFKKEQLLDILPCGHRFHALCTNRHFEEDMSCPQCEQDLHWGLIVA